MENDITWSGALLLFRRCREELIAKVQGLKYVNEKGNSFHFKGIRCERELEQIIEKSIKNTESYIAVKEAETISNNVYEVLYDAKIVRAQLKKLIDDKTLIKDTRYSEISRDFKEIYNVICEYHDIAEGQYKHVQEIIWGLVQVNNSINRRFFGYDYTFNYDSKE